MDYINLVIEHWDDILAVLGQGVLFFSVIAKMTSNTVDDNIVGKAIKIVDVLALNTKPTETRSIK